MSKQTSKQKQISYDCNYSDKTGVNSAINAGFFKALAYQMLATWYLLTYRSSMAIKSAVVCQIGCLIVEISAISVPYVYRAVA